MLVSWPEYRRNRGSGEPTARLISAVLQSKTLPALTEQDAKRRFLAKQLCGPPVQIQHPDRLRSVGSRRQWQMQMQPAKNALHGYGMLCTDLIIAAGSEALSKFLANRSRL
jgi:hypothetical protein